MKTSSEGVVVSTRLDPNTAKALRTRARDAYRTPSAEIRRAIDLYLTADLEQRPAQTVVTR